MLHAGFYQRVLKSVSDFKELGDKLVQVAEYERAFRHYDRVDEIAQILTNLPLTEHQLIGQYYLGLCEFSKGIYAVDVFEDIAEKSSTKYRFLAMHSLASIERRRGDYDTELAWLLESLKITPSIQAFRGIAILKAIEGNHKAAVNDFERCLPLIRYAGPLPYYDFLNSYAVELGEVGRKDEARNVMRVVLASPFALAYPEWQQTAADLQSASRSMVQVAGLRVSPDNVLSLPRASERVVQSPLLRPGERTGRLLNYTRFKKKMVKKQKGEPDEDAKAVAEMDKKDLVTKLLELTAYEGVDEEALRKVVQYAVEVMPKR
jgi:tetratricopeptide (TPR) repeat protein